MPNSARWSPPAHPRLLAEPGCGVLTAAKLVGEIADVTRFSSDAKLARNAGAAPIPAPSGRTQRHRLDHGGNRQINCALHRLATTKRPPGPRERRLPRPPPRRRQDPPRSHPLPQSARVWHLLQPDPETTIPTSTPDRPTRPITIHCNRPVGTPQLR